MKKIFIITLTVILFAVIAAPAVYAEGENGPYVEDMAGLLTSSQLNELETKAGSISNRFGCDVRIITVADMAEYGFSDIEAFTLHIYNESGYGYGPDRNCAIFLLSMKERDCDLRVWGESVGKKAFTFYGIDTILDRHILPRLSDDDYYRAFSNYLTRAEEYLQMAKDGAPFDRNNDNENDGAYLIIKIVVLIALPLIIALIVCSGWKSQMKTAKKARAADNYIPENGFNLTVKEDRFLYRTTTRQKIEKSSSSSGGGARSGGGGSSGRSGKF